MSQFCDCLLNPAPGDLWEKKCFCPHNEKSHFGSPRTDLLPWYIILKKKNSKFPRPKLGAKIVWRHNKAKKKNLTYQTGPKKQKTWKGHGRTQFGGWGCDRCGPCRDQRCEPACQLVTESVDHRLTSTWFVPLSLVCMWCVPLLVCDHSQGVYFPPTGGGEQFF